MEWIEVQIHTSHEAIEPITNILNDFGANGVVIKDSLDLTKKRQTEFGEIYELDKNEFPENGVFINAYLTNDEHFINKLEKIKRKINNLKTYDIYLGKNEIKTTKIKEDDWATAWKKYYEPTTITNQVTIVPNWETYEKQNEQEIIVKMDPGMAFGTGTHPTTRLAAQFLEKYLTRSDDIIDVGCGSGILSIISAKLGANHVYAYDLDDVAIKSTQINCSLNDVSNRVTVTKSNLLENIEQKANIIVANILTHILIKLIKDVRKNLPTNGRLILSGIIKKNENDLLDCLNTYGFKVIDRKKEDDWIALVAQKE